MKITHSNGNISLWFGTQKLSKSLIIIIITCYLYINKCSTLKIILDFINFLFSFFFIRYFLYLHFKCYHLSWFPSENPLSPPPSPCSPTNPLPLPGPGIPLCWGIEPSQEQRHLLPLMTNQVILCYICSYSHESHDVFSLVGGLVPKSSGQFILLFFLWDCKFL